MRRVHVGGKIVKSKQLNIIDESQKPYITILLLAWPVFVEQIFSTLVSFIDTAMVGSLGAEAQLPSVSVTHRYCNAGTFLPFLSRRFGSK